MKFNKIRALLAGALAVAMLLPCLFIAPVQAASGPVQMYYFQSKSVEEDGKAISSNLVNGTPYPAYVRPCYVMTKYTDNGPVSVPTACFKEGVTSGSSGIYGNPYGEKVTMGYRITENLKMVLEQMPVIITRGKEVINLEFEYVVRTSVAARNAVFDDQMKIFVSLDGETWLPDYVGMRCANLTAAGVDHQGKDVVFYNVQTENLLDIEGVEPGERIRKIMIMPNGTDAVLQTGHFIISELNINGYTSEAEFEAMHPTLKSTYYDPDLLRQIVLEECERAYNIAWTTDYTIYSSNAGGSSTLTDVGNLKTYPTGITWMGMVYDRNSDATRERHHATIVDGKHTAGYNGDSAMGMDCQTFAFGAAMRVARTSANSPVFMLGAAGIRFMDGTKHAARPQWNELDVIPYNTEQEMYKTYALCKPGDLTQTYTSSGAVHVRVVADVEVVYNPDGTINGEKSKMWNAEQTSGAAYEIQMADGSVYRMMGADYDAALRFIDANPGSRLLFAHCTYLDNETTFKDMYGSKYVAHTLTVYDDGMVQENNTQIVFNGKGGSDFVNTGLAIGMTTNYSLVRWDVKLEDVDTGKILFEDTAYGHRPDVRAAVYHDSNLDATLKELNNGNYRITAYAHAGPVTQLGQADLPVTTKSVEFAVTDRAAQSKVTLNATGSVAKGAEAEVTVSVNRAYDVADVEIKFDTDKLTYVSGSVTPECGMENISANKGVIRISCVDAAASSGQLAKLTFKAKDAVTLSDAVTLKSANVATAQQANVTDTAKATDKGTGGASVNMADVYPTAWYREAVDYALEKGIMGGYNATTFGPNDQLSRAMVVQVLYNNEGKPALTAGHTFPDVKSGDWFNNAVAWAAANKVVGGYGDGRFGPNDNVTLEQIAVILHNFSGTPEGTGAVAEMGPHSDWAANALSWAEGEGLFKGVPYEAVTGTATRAQTAQILMNYLSK